MTLENLALFAALGSALFFASASVVFARYSSQISVLWMNTFKAFVCALGVAVVLVFKGLSPITPRSLVILFSSGALALGIGDLFLLTAFARMGAARTLMLFGFQPVLIGVGSALFFGQPIGPERAIAIVFFMVCLFLLSFERYRTEGHWEIRGLLFAMAGVVLDNIGVLMTRWGFEQSPDLDPLQANLIRSLGALSVFAAISCLRPVYLWKNWKILPVPQRSLVAFAAFFGTSVSLSFYMFAVKNGHLASVSGVILTGPVFSAIIECIMKRKLPSWYLVGGLLCLLTGMGIALSAAQ